MGGYKMDTKLKIRRAPSSQASLAISAYDELKGRILRLLYAPGENILEERLRRELKVSRTPIRMALSKLEQEGLVLHRPGRGYFIRDIRLDEVRSLFQVREFLEVPATKFATENASEQELKELQAFVRKMDESVAKRHYNTYLDQAVEFHYRIALMTKNSILCDIVRGLNEKLSIVSRILLKSESKLARSHVEHHHILERMVKRDAEGAARIARKHVSDSSERQFQLLQSKAELLTIALPRNSNKNK
jgi:DNA-binding GntR family transcriptional regulator